MNKNISTFLAVIILLLVVAVASISILSQSSHIINMPEAKHETQKNADGLSGKTEPTNEWQTYSSDRYGFEIKYPGFLKNRMDLAGVQNENEDHVILNLYAENGGSMSVGILKEKLDPKNIIGAFGKIPIKDLKKISVDKVISYRYGFGDAGNWGNSVRIPYGNETIQISFRNCDQCADVLKYENAILSTFKFSR